MNTEFNRILTPKDQKEIALINGIGIEFESLYRALAGINNIRLRDLSYRVKEKGSRKGEFGYYMSANVGTTIAILDTLEAKNFGDLGSGAGIILSIIKQFRPKIKVTGYEIEPELVGIASKLLRIQQTPRNILSLKASDVKEHDVLHFFEPFATTELAKKFVEKLTTISHRNQYVLSAYRGYATDLLIRSANWREVKLPDLGFNNKKVFVRS